MMMLGSMLYRAHPPLVRGPQRTLFLTRMDDRIAEDNHLCGLSRDGE
jgi:hypothetical protein